MAYIVRYFFTFLCALYIYTKLLNIYTLRKKYYVTLVLFSLLSSLFVYTLPNLGSPTKFCLVFLLSFLFVTLYTRTRWYVSITVSVISFALSFSANAVSGILLSLFVTLFSIEISPVSSGFLLMGGLLQVLLINRIFRIRRLQKGMLFLQQGPFISIGIILSLVMITLFLFSNINSLTTSLPILLLMLVLVFLTFSLFHWWRRKITQNYLERLRISEVESLYKQLAEKNAEIDKLLQNNDELSRIVHKDNKLIPAMEHAVTEYLENAAVLEPNEAKQYGEALISRLQNMSAERLGILQTRHDIDTVPPKTGIYTVDAVVSYMSKRADFSGIQFEVKYDPGLKPVLQGHITEEDVSHLLCDAIENAMIAILHTEPAKSDAPNIHTIPDKPSHKKEILLHMGFVRKDLFIDLSDNGIPFEPSTYENWGKQKHTTHVDSGGSGIGLMDIWILKQKYKFSLHIYEQIPENHVFTKKIRFLFDGKNEYLIQSYRDRQISSLTTRNDLHVFPYVEKKTT